MKRNRVLFFLIIAVSYGCTLEDITPSYAGKYDFTYIYTQTKYGITTNFDPMVGVMEVGEGSANETVTLNNATDSKGNLIEFNVKGGNYRHVDNFEMEGCQCELTIEGRFDSANYMTYKQLLVITCGKDRLTAVLEGKAVR